MNHRRFQPKTLLDDVTQNKQKDDGIMSTNETLPIVVQLYSLRSLPESFDELLGQVAAIGYPGVETVGAHGLSSDEMSALLDKHGLKVIIRPLCSCSLLQNDLGEVIAFNKAIGNDVDHRAGAAGRDARQERRELDQGRQAARQHRRTVCG